MLLRELYQQEEQQLDEFAPAALLAVPAYEFLIAGGLTIAAWWTSKMLQDAEIRIPSLRSDFESSIEQALPTSPTIPMQALGDYTINAQEIEAYLATVNPSGGPSRRNGKRRRNLSWLDEVIEWLLDLLGSKLLKILVAIGLSIYAMYAVYRMSRWIYNKFKSGEIEKDVEKKKGISNDKESDESLDEKLIWGRNGNKVVRKYRCSGGRRHGRIVSKMGQCFAPLDIAQSTRFKRLKARIGGKMSRKAKRTKRVNPASKRVQALNK